MPCSLRSRLVFLDSHSFVLFYPCFQEVVNKKESFSRTFPDSDSCYRDKDFHFDAPHLFILLTHFDNVDFILLRATHRTLISIFVVDFLE